MRYFPRVLRYLRPYWRLAVLAVVLMVVGAGVALLVPWPLQIIFDNVLDTKPVHPFLRRIFGALAADRFKLMLTVVIVGFLIVLLQDALNVFGTYINV